MKKSTIDKIRQKIAIILIVLMSIDGYAAVVSDNDGAAFITKAEFDSLKNSFQTTLNGYNENIDNKITQAISAYVSGAKVSNRTQKSIITKNWEYVTEVNGALKNTYDYPDVTGNVMLGDRIIEAGTPVASLSDAHNMGRNNDWWKMVWCVAELSYRCNKPKNTRNLVSGVTIGTTLDKTKMYWVGRANRVRETWTLSTIRTWERNPSTMKSNDPTNKFIICSPLNLVRTGYISNYSDASSPVWSPSVRWKRAGMETYDDFGTGTIFANSSIPTVEYEEDDDGDKMSYEHIITHKNDDSWELTVQGVTNYLTNSSSNSLRTRAWLATTSTSGKWSGSEFAFVKNYDTTVYRAGIGLNALTVDNVVEWMDNTSANAANNRAIPTIGLIGTGLSNTILQYETKTIKDADGVNVPDRKLHEGLPLMKVKRGEKVEWEPVFKDIKITGTSGVKEAKLKLAYQPFSDKGVSTDYVKMDNVTLGNWLTTSDKTVKVKFTATKDGYIYLKWVPNTTDTVIDGSNFWEVTLDIPNCSTYVSVKE